MKIIILAFVAIVITAGVYGQAGSTNGKKSPQELNKTQNQNLQNNPQDLDNNKNQKMQISSVDKSSPDGVIMQNGKMMKVKNGQMTFLDNEMTLSNGTKIMSDGTCVKNDGTKITMKEGQQMDMSGT